MTTPTHQATDDKTNQKDGTYLILVPKGSGTKGRPGKTDCILYPRPPIKNKERVWYFSIDTEDAAVADTQYQNLVILFEREIAGPQDSYVVEFSMAPSAIEDGWSFIKPGIEFKETDQQHDIKPIISAKGEKLSLIITFNDKQSEALDYYFTAEYQGNPTTSIDPIMVLGARPPRM